MGTTIIGKNAYAYVGGDAVVNLKDFTLRGESPPIPHDPDIGTTRIAQSVGFLSESGNFTFNFSSDDFEDLWDAFQAQTAVSLYLYPETGASKIYMYGNAFLTSFNHENTLLGTVAGNCDFVNSDGTGFARQTTAA